MDSGYHDLCNAAVYLGKKRQYQGIGKDVPLSQRTPSWEIPIKALFSSWVFTGYNSEESLENTINTMVVR